MVVTSRILGGMMISTLAQNAIYAGLIPALGTIFPNFITPATLFDLFKAIRENLNTSHHVMPITTFICGGIGCGDVVVW